jgi:hypothetical protein
MLVVVLEDGEHMQAAAAQRPLLVAAALAQETTPMALLERQTPAAGVVAEATAEAFFPMAVALEAVA